MHVCMRALAFDRTIAVNDCTAVTQDGSFNITWPGRARASATLFCAAPKAQGMCSTASDPQQRVNHATQLRCLLEIQRNIQMDQDARDRAEVG